MITKTIHSISKTSQVCVLISGDFRIATFNNGTETYSMSIGNRAINLYVKPFNVPADEVIIAMNEFEKIVSSKHRTKKFLNDKKIENIRNFLAECLIRRANKENE